MSDEEDDIPPREECEKRCQEFAQVTGTDTALAMFFLQDRDWDLERALNAYFEENGGMQQPTHATGTGRSLSSDNKVASNTAASSKEDEDPKPNRIRLLSWNIDGLDQKSLKTRTKAVCQIIQRENPDVVFLQEVISPTQHLIEERCPQYQFFAGDTGNDPGDYYIGIMLKIQTVTYKDHKVIPFETSRMSRNLLVVEASVKGIDFQFMTSHLESTKDHADERKRQLRKCFQQMSEISKGKTVIFGGDLNLRDKEVQDVGGIPEKVLDLWECTGKREEAKFTWDMRRNTNLEFPGRFKPALRFDRIYMRHSEPKKVKPVYFELIGLQKIENCGKFPSDHWGILAHFDKT